MADYLTIREEFEEILLEELGSKIEPWEATNIASLLASSCIDKIVEVITE